MAEYLDQKPLMQLRLHYSLNGHTTKRKKKGMYVLRGTMTKTVFADTVTAFWRNAFLGGAEN